MDAPKKLYAFWTGDDEMSPNRQWSMRVLRECPGIEAILVDKNNLEEYLYEPLHPGYQYLSSTHKSDYLRSYFLYEYGGIYSDVKSYAMDWGDHVDELNASEKTFYGMATDSLLGEGHVGVHCGCYIVKPGSKLVSEWKRRTNEKMDSIYDELLQRPGTYHPRATTGGSLDGGCEPRGYPLEWCDLLGWIIHPIVHEMKDAFLTGLPVNLVNHNYR